MKKVDLFELHHIKKTIKIDSVPIKISVLPQEELDVAKMRIYLFPKNENIVENWGNRYNRPINTWKKIGREVLNLYGFPKDTKIKFSQYAGCTCGCSPGLIVDNYCHIALYVDYKF